MSKIKRSFREPDIYDPILSNYTKYLELEVKEICKVTRWPFEAESWDDIAPFLSIRNEIKMHQFDAHMIKIFDMVDEIAIFSEATDTSPKIAGVWIFHKSEDGWFRDL